MMNFFVSLSNQESPIRRLPLTRPVQTQLGALFGAQRAALLRPDRERLEFTAGFVADDDSLSYIAGYELPAVIDAAVRNPTACEPLTSPEENLPFVRAVLGVDPDSAETLFQSFDRRRLLAPGRFSQVFSADTFRRLDEPGLTLDSHVVAALVGDRLYFESYFAARTVLDLSAYYREATNPEIEQFCTLPRLAVERPQQVVDTADSWTRRKIAFILQSGILEREGPRKIQQAALDFEIELVITRQGGQERIVLPEDRRELKQFLRFLEEDYFNSVLTGTKYLAGSKRKIRR